MESEMRDGKGPQASRGYHNESNPLSFVGVPPSKVLGFLNVL